MDAGCIVEAFVELGLRYELFGLLNHEGAVHQKEGLLRDGGFVTAASFEVGIGEIEIDQNICDIRAIDTAIYGAQSGIRLGIQLDRPAKHVGIEGAANGEQ